MLAQFRRRSLQLALLQAKQRAAPALAQTARVSAFHSSRRRDKDENPSESSESSAHGALPIVAGIAVPPRAEPAPPGLFDRFGLGDWKVSVPLGIALGVPMLTKGVYVLTEETQLAACFLMFCTLMYKYSGDMIGSYFDARAAAILEEQNAAEDANIELAKETLQTHASMLTIQQDMTALAEAHTAAVALMCQVEASKLRHKTREVFVQNLEAIHRIEVNYNLELKRAMIKAATQKVRAVVEKGDVSMKAAAFKNALSVLSEVTTPSTAKSATAAKTSSSSSSKKQEQDKVVELFVKELHKFAKDLEAKEGQVFKLTPEEQAELQSELDAYMSRYGLEDAGFKASEEITFKLL